MPSNSAILLIVLYGVLVHTRCEKTQTNNTLGTHFEPIPLRSKLQISTNNTKADSIILYSNHIFVLEKKSKPSLLIQRPRIVHGSKNELSQRSKRSAEDTFADLNVQQNPKNTLSFSSEQRSSFPNPVEDLKLDLELPVTLSYKSIVNEPFVPLTLDKGSSHSILPPITDIQPPLLDPLPFNADLKMPQFIKNSGISQFEVPSVDLPPPNLEPLTSFYETHEHDLKINIPNDLLPPSMEPVSFISKSSTEEVKRPLLDTEDVISSHIKYLNTLSDYTKHLKERNYENENFGTVQSRSNLFSIPENPILSETYIPTSDIPSKNIFKQFSFLQPIHDEHSTQSGSRDVPIQGSLKEIDEGSHRRSIESNLINLATLSELTPPLFEPFLNNRHTDYVSTPQELGTSFIYQSPKNGEFKLKKSDMEDVDYETDDASITMESFSSDVLESEMPEEPSLPLPPLPPTPPPPPPVPKPSKVSQPTLPSTPTKVPNVPIPSLPVVLPPKFNPHPTVSPTPPPPPPLNTHRPAIFAPIIPPETDQDDCQPSSELQDVQPIQETLNASPVSSSVFQYGPTIYSKNVYKTDNAAVVENTYSYMSPENIPVRISVYTKQ